MHGLNKGLGFATGDTTKLGWNLLREDLSLPCAVLYEERLQHNLAWMQRFIEAYGMKLAPHGKTTMAPKLFTRQLAGGAWGITLATAHQTVVAYRHGVRRVLMANQLVGKENMAMIARLLEDPEFEFYCLVDSAALVEQLGAFFAGRGLKLRVLLELGVAGGRAGVRDEVQLGEVLEALSRWRESVVVSGVEIYEGVLEDEGAIRGLLQRAVAVMRRLAAEGRFGNDRRCFPARVRPGMTWWRRSFLRRPLRRALRLCCGCYLTHDIGVYRDAQAKIQERNPVAREMREGAIIPINGHSEKTAELSPKATNRLALVSECLPATPP